MKRLIAAIGIAAMLLASGCNDPVGIKEAVKDVKESTDKVSSSVTDASKNFANGITEAAKSLESGSKVLDPIGLKKLIDENGDLRKSVEILQGRLAALPTGEGVIDLAGRPLQFTVAQYTGGFRVNAYVDSPENHFWVNKVLTRNPLNLDIGKDARLKALNEEFFGRHKEAIKTISDGYKKAIEELQKQPGFIPRAEESTVDLNSQLGSGSLHKLVVVVTPTEADANNKWSLRGKVILKSGGNIETLKEFDVGSDLTPGHKVGEPLSPVTLLLMVKRSANGN